MKKLIIVSVVLGVLALLIGLWPLIGVLILINFIVAIAQSWSAPQPQAQASTFQETPLILRLPPDAQRDLIDCRNCLKACRDMLAGRVLWGNQSTDEQANTVMRHAFIFGNALENLTNALEIGSRDAYQYLGEAR